MKESRAVYLYLLSMLMASMFGAAGQRAQASQIAVSHLTPSFPGDPIELYDLGGNFLGGFGPAGESLSATTAVFSIAYDQATGDLYSLVDVGNVNSAKGIWRRSPDGTVTHVIPESMSFLFDSNSTIAVIPEPSTALLLASGLVALAVAGRPSLKQ